MKVSKKLGRALIEAGDKIIVVEEDLCHVIMDVDSIISVMIPQQTNKNIKFVNQEFNFGQVKKLLKDESDIIEKSLKEFCRYFEIKDRVLGNYNLFKKTLKKFNIEEIELPTWE